jgi:DNA-binding GntR family transcriptional regulator
MEANMGSGGTPLRAIIPRSLSEEAANILREAILSGQFAQGQRLSEPELATRLGISRIPVREALGRLEYEGLITSSPNRGSFVRYFREEDLVEIFDLRAALEGLACQIIASERKLSPADLDQLERYIEDFRRSVAVGDYPGWVESEIAFHEFILRKAGSNRLLEMWQNLHVQCVYATREDWQDFLTAYGSHPVILRALREGTPEQMIPLHQEIYGRVKRTAVQLLRRKDTSVVGSTG